MRYKKLSTIADNGNMLDTLKALRQKIARTIDESESGRGIAALSRQLQMVLCSIKELEEAQKTEEPSKTVLDIVRERHQQELKSNMIEDPEEEAL